MIIWKGMGLLVPVTLLLSGIVVMFIWDDASGPLGNLLFFWIAALLCFALDIAIKKYRHATCEEAIVENKRTGKEKVVLAKRHTNMRTGEVFETIIEDSFFFIPVRFWVAIYMVIGAMYYYFM